jgi:hypothetical protein
MKKLKSILNHFFAKKTINTNCEKLEDNSHGDLVPLVWMIEKLRRREEGCTMNELIAEANKNFKGLGSIKHKTINYK